MTRPRFNRASVSVLVLALLTAAGGFWWLCARSEAIAFLPTRAGAEWIVVPGETGYTIHDAIPVTAAFRHSWALSTQPATAMLTVCAFKDAAVAINGRQVSPLPTRGNWKLPSSAEVAGLLQPGTNVIMAWVTNAVGPPALWLCLKSVGFSLGTSERWQVSLNGTEWQNARCARQPPEFQWFRVLRGSTGVTDWLKRVWPVEAAFCAVSLALIWAIKRWLRQKRPPAATLPPATSTKLIYGLLVIVLIARAALLLNNLPQLPRSMGFDAAGHEQYIEFIQQKHALPLADDGWEMCQPPLYYLASTLVLDLCGRSVADEEAVYFLRAVNGVIGLLHCWLVLLCLRLLFEGNLPAQAAGLLVAAFLPPHLYLSQYVTNEPLAGFLVTVAIYLCLRALRAEQAGLGMPIGIGVALGAAMLAKFSVVLALPFFPAALTLPSAARKQLPRREWFRSVGAIVAGCLIVCGWHYGRVWARFGTPNVGNWDPQAGRVYWQDPGFRTSAYYSSFGRSLISPTYSAFHSFADGIYSTLWGDGLASGVADPNFLPPWNYDLMGAGYWISLGVCLLLVIGAVRTLARLTGQIRAEWFLVVGIVCVFGLALVWFSLGHPQYSVGKAFYAFSALLPFSALVAVGWDWLRQRHRIVGIAVWVLLLVWSVTVYASFWVRSGNPATRLVRSQDAGLALMHRGRFDEAVRQFQEVIRMRPGYASTHNILADALARNGQIDEAIRRYQEAIRVAPDYAEPHYNLGNVLSRLGQIDEAIRQYQEAIHLKPDFAEAYNNLGIALGGKGQMDEALRQFQEATRRKPHYAEAHYNLGLALASKGQTEKAILRFEAALKVKPDYAEAHNQLGQARLRKGQTDEAIRQFQEALRLKPDYAEARKNLDILLKRNEVNP